MYKRIFSLLVIVTIFLLSCNKEEIIVKPVATVSSNQAAASLVDNSRGWYGLYKFYYDDPDDFPKDTLGEERIIANGETRVPYIEDVNTTTINYDIPLNRVIHGDSTTFNLSVKDSSGQVLLSLIGTKNTASFWYYSYKDTGYYSIGLGSIYKQIKVFPATNFNNFKLVQFGFTQNKLSVHVAGKLITSFNYNTKSKMGQLKQLSLGNPGYIECDFVRLYNSFTQNFIMREEFNLNGKSHTIFY